MTTNSNFDDFENLGPEDLGEMIGQQYRRHGNYVMTACYNVAAHKNGDRKPSLVIYGYEKGYHCFGCSESGTNSWLLKQFGVRPDVPAGERVVIDRPAPAPDPREELSKDDNYTARLQAVWESLPELPEEAVEMMLKKGLDPEMFDEVPGDPLMKWKWHPAGTVKGWGDGIFIPYTFQGKMITARLRILNPGDGPRFLSMPGNIMWPYNLDAVMKNKRCFVTEGETDCLTANLIGLPAAAIPGATSGKAIEKLFEVAQDYGTELYVIGDNDPAGQGFTKRMQLMGYDKKVSVDVIEIPAFKDINEWFVREDIDKIRAWAKIYQPRQSKPRIVPPAPKPDDIVQSVMDIWPEAKIQPIKK